MASLAGYNGLITCTGTLKDGGEAPNNVISDGTLFRWSLQMDREMRRVTPLDVSDARFMPGHGQAFVDVEGYINNAESPGSFNTVGVMMVLLQPDQSSLRQILIWGWTERIEWIVALGAMQTFRARIRAASEPIYYWTNAS